MDFSALEWFQGRRTTLDEGESQGHPVCERGLHFLVEWWKGK